MNKNQIDKYIEKKLTNIEKAYDIQIIYACLMGSRGYGFPSHNSDYDVRFIYIRKRDWYLSIGSKTLEDIIKSDFFYDIELGDESGNFIDGIDDYISLEIVGYDVRKFLSLALNSNPLCNEWITAPKVYIDIDWGMCVSKEKTASGSTMSCMILQDFIKNTANIELYKHHYKSLYSSYRDVIDLKIYCHVIRCALATKYLNDYEHLPPP